MIRCLNCHAETSNGLALCALCAEYARSCLEFLPVYYRNLARWRPGRTGSRQVPGSRVLWDGEPRGRGDRIGIALDETLTALLTTARVLAEQRSLPRPRTEVDAVLAADLPDTYADRLNADQPRLVALLCAGLDTHLTSIATTDWAGEMVRELGDHETRLRRLTETAVPGWYAGTCRCGAPTHVVPGLTWVTCRGCGTTTAARDHLEVILTEATDWVARPMRLAEAIVALVDTEQSVPRLYERVKKWGQRGHIAPVRRLDAEGDETGPMRFRLGDVLDRLAAEGATRTDATPAAVS